MHRLRRSTAVIAKNGGDVKAVACSPSRIALTSVIEYPDQRSAMNTAAEILALGTLAYVEIEPQWDVAEFVALNRAGARPKAHPRQRPGSVIKPDPGTPVGACQRPALGGTLSAPEAATSTPPSQVVLQGRPRIERRSRPRPDPARRHRGYRKARHRKRRWSPPLREGRGPQPPAGSSDQRSASMRAARSRSLTLNSKTLPCQRLSSASLSNVTPTDLANLQGDTFKRPVL